MSQVLIVYATTYGNTHKMALAIADGVIARVADAVKNIQQVMHKNL